LSNFYLELIKASGKYPDTFNYLPIPFIPCSIDCANALDKSSQWKDALEINDPSAAQALVSLNKRRFLEDSETQKAFTNYLNSP